MWSSFETVLLKCKTRFNISEYSDAYFVSKRVFIFNYDAYVVEYFQAQVSQN
jgi:hypothetical protein